MSKKIKVNMISESEFTVQGHGVHTAYLEMLNALRARRDVDVEPNTNRPANIVHVQTFGPYSLFKLLFNRGARKIISVHVVPASLVGSIKGAKIWMPFMRGYMKFFYNLADICLACSNNVAESLKHELKVKKPQIQVMYNTVDMAKYKTTPADRARARKMLGIKPNEFVVIGNGQLQPRKRIDSFVAVAKKLPNLKFIWIGGIPFKALGAEIHKVNKIVDSAPKNVIWTGIIPLEKVKTYLQTADVFWLPAEQENHPMAVLEAAGAGLPIVLRDIPEYDDTFRGAALLGQDKNFAEIISKLSTDKKYYADGQRGSAKIAKRFDSRAGGEKLMEIYRSLL